jgi:hypothetical protein
MARVTLTKAELSTPAGEALVALITRIGADGEITFDELSELESAVSERGPFADLTAAEFLRDIIHEIIADGRIDIIEAESLRRGLARVLPKGIRERFEDALPADPDANRPAWYYDVITERQVMFLRKLGHADPHSMNKGEASVMIDSLLNSQANHNNAGARVVREFDDYDTTKPTDRQMMVLRFWGRPEPMTGTRQHVSDIIDSWYSGEPRKKIAWEEWKKAQGRDITNPDDVPFGIGEEWLQKVKEQIAQDMERVRHSLEKSRAEKRTTDTAHLSKGETDVKPDDSGFLAKVRRWFSA